jgi:hypothetical protein
VTALDRFGRHPQKRALKRRMLWNALAAEVSCWYNDSWHSCVYYPGYPYVSPGVTPPLMTGRSVAEYPGYATTPEALAADVTAPLMTGRSVAVSPEPGAVAGPGNYCATSVKTCLLREPGWLGTGCSCKVYGGRARGFVE